MKTGNHLKIENFGDNVQGVELFGEKERSETNSFLIKFPTGEVEIARGSNGDYWVHIAQKKNTETDNRITKFIKARMDFIDKPTSQAVLGDFNNPNMYHIAILTSKCSQ